MKTLIFGALAGALAAIYWHDDLMRLREQSGGNYSGTFRERIADTLESFEGSLGEGLDKTRDAACSTLRSWSHTVRGSEGRSAAPMRSDSIPSS
jgi:hypothetical protein